MRRPRSWMLGFVPLWLAIPAALPGCWPDGAATIHLDRSAESKVMVMPARDAVGPTRADTRRGARAARSRSTQR